MYNDHLQLVEQTLQSARESASLQQLAEVLFATFFERNPEAEAFFEGFDLAEVGPFKYCKISDALVDVLKYPDYSRTSVSEEVYRHQIHDVKDRHYYVALAEAFVDTLRKTLADNWTAHHDEVWNDTLGGLKHNIDLAAREHLSSGAA